MSEVYGSKKGTQIPLLPTKELFSEALFFYQFQGGFFIGNQGVNVTPAERPFDGLDFMRAASHPDDMLHTL
jgi:hypothetical protein